MKMKAKLLGTALIFLVILIACNKDVYSSKPTLKFISVNGDQFKAGDIVEFKLQVTDKEGDLGSSYSGQDLIWDTVWFQRISKVCPDQISDKPSTYAMPVFTDRSNLKGDLSFTFVFDEIDPSLRYPTLAGRCTLRDDSSYFRFWIKDRANHVSDTITSPVITFLK